MCTGKLFSTHPGAQPRLRYPDLPFLAKTNAMDPYILTLCSIVYNLWSGYFRGDGSSFMGVNRQTGWRGGHRVYREIGHGAYLVFNLAQVQGCWGLGSLTPAQGLFEPSSRHPSNHPHELIFCLSCSLASYGLWVSLASQTTSTTYPMCSVAGFWVRQSH